MVRSIACLLTFVALAFPALADDSRQHDELSEQQLGTVHFPISCAPSVQKSFERGVALPAFVRVRNRGAHLPPSRSG